MRQRLVAIALLFPLFIPLQSLAIPAAPNGHFVKRYPDNAGPHTGLTLENQSHHSAANDLHCLGERQLTIKKWTTGNKGADTFIHDPIIRQGAI